ncbi:efflux RND transporter periplasmic adaptor subunit [Caloranaerobacter ferrireducens]|uniref:efflux RND transporter periplasmic adaptor subunit n=1 Tax=Caloranaerobacter ferrireducens TaxID=1323370 RepID=UPI00084E0678|nr:efflux RND transporter periplasmic adaptor subunit [Caloranaerobacter ferrireducens]
MKKKGLIIGVIIILVISAFVIANSIGKAKEAEVYKVSKGDIVEYIDETAQVKSESDRMIYSKIMGDVDEIKVEVGDRVKKGDILVIINTDNIELEIKSLKARLEALKATYKEAVKEPDKELINQAEARVRSAKILLDEAMRNYENSKKLYESGAISFDQYKTALDNLNLQKESLQIAENELEQIKKGVSSNIKEQYLAQIRELEYQIDKLYRTRDDYFIKSPVDGMILDLNIKEGDYLQIGTPVLEIGDNEDIYLQADVLVDEIDKINKDTQVIVYSDELNINGSGKVKKIYPKAFSKISDLGIEQKRVKVDIDLLTKIPTLKVGYEVDVKFVADKRQNVIVVPESAVFDFEGEDYVYVVEEDTAKLRKVNLGLKNDDVVEVISGLKEGDLVILSPDKEIKEGTKIKQIRKE